MKKKAVRSPRKLKDLPNLVFLGRTICEPGTRWRHIMDRYQHGEGAVVIRITTGKGDGSVYWTLDGDGSTYRSLKSALAYHRNRPRGVDK